ncbi:MAG: DUF2723 domain-containing protein [Caldilineaceae bacterium]|nr:DUF2723 domain-containing protein [Caldilineaceae bacterium]
MPNAATRPSPPRADAPSNRLDWLAAMLVGAATFALYLASLAPSLTWAHQGADGGELLAAAMTNGVPHPPGYPLYTFLLQGWLELVGLLAPGSDIAWRGNLLSALFAAGSAGLTVPVIGSLLARQPLRWLWASLGGLLWAVSPLLWSQAIITEVYSLHALLVILLAWSALVKPQRLWYVVLSAALGVAHHLTFVLLLPAALYALATGQSGRRRWVRPVGALLLGMSLGALLYLRIPLVAGNGPPPVNWGYADNWQGFWWLVSGAAYRGYLFSTGGSAFFPRVAAWAYTVTMQYTPAGLAIALAGLADWDRSSPRLRNFALLWIVPVSIYAIAYYTRDSEIYLLPVVWMMAVWLTVGLAVIGAWLQRRFTLQPRWNALLWTALGLAGILALTAGRWSALALREDREARDYLSQSAQVLEPDSILVTLGDAETFSVWYGVWASGDLSRHAPGLVPLNDSLYQFDWYRRLQRELHPAIPAIDQSAADVVAANVGKRAIYFAELPPWVAREQLEQVGPLWKLKP